MAVDISLRAGDAVPVSPFFFPSSSSLSDQVIIPIVGRAQPGRSEGQDRKALVGPCSRFCPLAWRELKSDVVDPFSRPKEVY